MHLRNLVFVLLVVLPFFSPLTAQVNSPVKISGTVSDARTRESLPGECLC